MPFVISHKDYDAIHGIGISISFTGEVTDNFDEELVRKFFNFHSELLINKLLTARDELEEERKNRNES